GTCSSGWTPDDALVIHPFLVQVLNVQRTILIDRDIAAWLPNSTLTPARLRTLAKHHRKHLEAVYTVFIALCPDVCGSSMPVRNHENLIEKLSLLKSEAVEEFRRQFLVRSDDR